MAASKVAAPAVYVRLLGGLGNQLFQYAMGRQLADERDTELVLDSRFILRKHCVSGLAIDEFNIRARYLNNAESNNYSELSWKLTRALRRKIRPALGYYHETSYGFDANLGNQPSACMLSGFWQSYKYFSLTPQLLQDLTLTAGLPAEALTITQQMAATNSVAIHVRRGDYLSDPKALVKHGLCSDRYYNEALQLINAEVQEPTYYVFSDDPEWVKAHLGLRDAIFVSDAGFSPEVDLVMIGRCKHQIIANSSFSWWGAYINQNPHKLVMAPSPWFDDADNYPDQDLIPPDWKIIAK